MNGDFKAPPEGYILIETAEMMMVQAFKSGRDCANERWAEVLRAKLQEWNYIEPEPEPADEGSIIFIETEVTDGLVESAKAVLEHCKPHGLDELEVRSELRQALMKHGADLVRGGDYGNENDNQRADGEGLSGKVPFDAKPDTG